MEYVTAKICPEVIISIARLSCMMRVTAQADVPIARYWDVLTSAFQQYGLATGSAIMKISEGRRVRIVTHLGGTAVTVFMDAQMSLQTTSFAMRMSTMALVYGPAVLILTQTITTHRRMSMTIVAY